MRHNLYHGNRLRSPHDAYEVKKQRAKERYAAAQLKINSFWLQNKILRELKNLYGLDTEIPYTEFIERGFDFTICRSKISVNGRLVLLYDEFGIYILSNKNLCIYKTNN